MENWVTIYTLFMGLLYTVKENKYTDINQSELINLLHTIL